MYKREIWVKHKIRCESEKECKEVGGGEVSASEGGGE